MSDGKIVKVEEGERALEAVFDADNNFIALNAYVGGALYDRSNPQRERGCEGAARLIARDPGHSREWMLLLDRMKAVVSKEVFGVDLPPPMIVVHASGDPRAAVEMLKKLLGL